MTEKRKISELTEVTSLGEQDELVFVKYDSGPVGPTPSPTPSPTPTPVTPSPTPVTPSPTPVTPSPTPTPTPAPISMPSYSNLCITGDPDPSYNGTYEIINGLDWNGWPIYRAGDTAAEWRFLLRSQNNQSDPAPVGIADSYWLLASGLGNAYYLEQSENRIGDMGGHADPTLDSWNGPEIESGECPEYQKLCLTKTGGAECNLGVPSGPGITVDWPTLNNAQQDCGTYELEGEWNGKPYWKKVDPDYGTNILSYTTVSGNAGWRIRYYISPDATPADAHRGANGLVSTGDMPWQDPGNWFALSFGNC